MRDRDYTTASDFLKRLFAETLHKVEVRVCPNIKGSGNASSLMLRDVGNANAYCKANDSDSTGVYFGACTRHEDAKSGNLDSVMECPALWVDIDCVKQGLSGQTVLDTLGFLPFPPTIIINSGGGIHAWWVLDEYVDVSIGATENRQAVTHALKRLAHILAGDIKCAELARIMRLPGTMNSKPATVAIYGEPFVCEILSDSGFTYSFDDLSEWLESARVLLKSTVVESDRPVREDDPFVAYARNVGYEPSINIEAELDAMGDGNIHQTQLRVSMSLLARGYEDDEIVDIILAATERAAPSSEKWNWTAEEKAIRGMIASGRKKEIKKERAAPVKRTTSSGHALQLVHDDEPKPAKKAPRSKDDADPITALGSSALSVWRDRYGPILFSHGTSYFYEGGVWTAWDERHDQMLRILMQEACVSLNLAPKPATISGATLYFLNRPGLLEREVEFDHHGLIIAEDATLDPRSLEIGEHSPAHRAAFKVGARLAGERDCPAFLSFLNESFADKEEAEIPLIVSTLQEWFGSCLVAGKPRSLCKGLLVYGGSRTGKTQLSEVLRALLGKGQTSATSAGDIGGDFGLQPFLGKRGWVADDAIGQGETLDAERYKKIVTGEEIGVRRKNRTDVMARFGFPVMLTANHLPKVRDQSDAVYNRSLVLPMTRMRPEGTPEPAGYNSISAKIIAEELTGVLWWAIEGWKRLSARGHFVEPACMKKAIGELQDNNNSVGAWLKECVEADGDYKVANADLFASFAGWYYQENGDGKFPWSQNGFIRRVKEAMPNLGYQKGARGRNLTGLKLTSEGLEYWSVNASRDSQYKPSGAALDDYSVNQSFSPEHAERAVASKVEDKSPRF